jgi:Homeodomain-like domain
VHDAQTVASVLRLAKSGLNNCEIARCTGVPRATVRDWVAGKRPRSCRARQADCCPRCGASHDLDLLGADYVYLLGLYLGDGSIATHERGVFRLRITLDVKYPEIVRECEATMRAVAPRNRVNRQRRRCNCYEVSSYSKAWPCLFPQHGPGKKHERPIFLADWQQKLAECWPDRLAKGLIHSDGCRSYSTGAGGWTQPRYVFSNRSTDITSIFCTACDRLGLRWTASFPKDESAAVSIYVSRKDDVAKLDEFVGPKR